MSIGVRKQIVEQLKELISLPKILMQYKGLRKFVKDVLLQQNV
jgi:hypothetical protein